MSRGLAIWVAVLAILAGAVFGVCLDRMVFDPRLRHFMRPGMHQQFMTRMQHDLALTPAQVPQVDSILKVQESRMERLRTEIAGRVGATQDTFMTAMSHVLTPEQMDKFKKMGPPRRHGFGRLFGGHHDRDHGRGPGGDDHGPGHAEPDRDDSVAPPPPPK